MHAVLILPVAQL